MPRNSIAFAKSLSDSRRLTTPRSRPLSSLNASSMSRTACPRSGISIARSQVLAYTSPSDLSKHALDFQQRHYRGTPGKPNHLQPYDLHVKFPGNWTPCTRGRPWIGNRQLCAARLGEQLAHGARRSGRAGVRREKNGQRKDRSAGAIAA